MEIKMKPNFILYDLVKSPEFSDAFAEWIKTLSCVNTFKHMTLSEIDFYIIVYTREIKISLSYKDSPQMEFCSIYKYMPKDSIHFYSCVDNDETLKANFKELLQRLQRDTKIQSFLDSI
jgi:hypothetical protein